MKDFKEIDDINHLLKVRNLTTLQCNKFLLTIFIIGIFSYWMIK